MVLVSLEGLGQYYSRGYLGEAWTRLLLCKLGEACTRVLFDIKSQLVCWGLDVGKWFGQTRITLLKCFPYLYLLLIAFILSIIVLSAYLSLLFKKFLVSVNFMLLTLNASVIQVSRFEKVCLSFLGYKKF